MARKKGRGQTGRGRGRGKGELNVMIGKGDDSLKPVIIGQSELEVFADAVGHGFVEEGSTSSQRIIVQVDTLEDIDEDDCASEKDRMVQDDYHSIHSEGEFPSIDDLVAIHSDEGFPILDNAWEIQADGRFQSSDNPLVNHEDHNHASDIESKKWSGLFKTEKTMGNLEFFEPKKVGDKIFINPPDDVVEEGVSQWRSCLMWFC